MIERDFDVSFIADLAFREKQVQQNYRPFIAVHKWFARRPGTLFRGLLLSEFVNGPLAETFYECQDLHGIRVADPFMGGGTPLLEANRVGCAVVGYDINPMAYWIVRQEIEHLNLDDYRQAATNLRKALQLQVGDLYTTRCGFCSRDDAAVKYFLWVKTIKCEKCQTEIKLFPGFVLAQNRRHPRNVLVCASCGALQETEAPRHAGDCSVCGHQLQYEGPAIRGKCSCPNCEAVNRFPQPESGPPRHVLFAIEYHCSSCRPGHQGRFFKKPDDHDLRKWREAEAQWSSFSPRFVPDEEIPAGDETDRLHRWGYRRYRDMFNERQLLGLELSCRLIDEEKDSPVHHALATNLSDLLRYQNMLCRYDTMALKSLDIFSVHGFPVGLIQCESNFLGIYNKASGACVGSGGWSNIIEKFFKAKEYCDHPFEYKHQGHRKERVSMSNEWIGDSPNGIKGAVPREVNIFRGDAARTDLPPGSLDAVLTDPPYFGNVQYAELMDFCYVWLRRLMANKGEGVAFNTCSTRNAEELTGNASMGRNLVHFTEGLSRVLQRMSIALKAGSPLAFTFHHNDISAYLPVAVAMLDAGLVCSASLPCPAEMGASIHINGTASSIVDTVFVCRSTGTVPKRWIKAEATGVARLVNEDLGRLRLAGIEPTAGDIRCIAYGHATRLAVWFLRQRWESNRPTAERLQQVTDWLEERLGSAAGLLGALEKIMRGAPCRQHWPVREKRENFNAHEAQIPF